MWINVLKKTEHASFYVSHKYAAFPKIINLYSAFTFQFKLYCLHRFPITKGFQEIQAVITHNKATLVFLVLTNRTYRYFSNVMAP